MIFAAAVSEERGKAGCGGSGVVCAGAETAGAETVGAETVGAERAGAAAGVFASGGVGCFRAKKIAVNRMIAAVEMERRISVVEVDPVRCFGGANEDAAFADGGEGSATETVKAWGGGSGGSGGRRRRARG